jgi:glycosyltransferase involved in cell wall biosynthesis
MICSHRAPPSLYATLRSILEQPQSERAEIVLVNNGFDVSKEQEILSLAQEKQANLKILREPTPGHGFARRTGFRNGSGGLYVLLDDDNTIGENFLPALLDLYERSPQTGAVVADVLPVWERRPPDWLVDFGRHCLSYNTTDGDKPGSARQWDPSEVTIAIRPPGGGMIIHRDVALHYLNDVTDPKRIKLSRSPGSLVAAEDEDIFTGVIDLKRAAVYSPLLKVYHHIPETRTRFWYLLRLNSQMQYSGALLRCCRGSASPRSAASELYHLVRPFASRARAVIRRRMPFPRALLELARETGAAFGRWRYPKVMG